MKRIFLFVLLLVSFNILLPVYTYGISPSPVLPTVNPLKLNTTINLVMRRLKAASFRMDNISQRMTSRLEKIKQMQINVAKLTSQSANISQQITKLKGKLNQAQEQVTVLSTDSDSSSAYRLFQQEIADINQTLKTILNDEKNILIQMKRLRIPAATVSATAVPNR